jgi:uncharacterized protein with HEPN domain
MKDTLDLLRDMLNSIDSIERLSVGSFEEFSKDDRTQDAIMYNLIILGEAANNIPNDFQEGHSEIPWSSIIGTRNVIVHGYDHVKLQIVWDIIQKNLSQLKKDLKKIIE